jgi:methionyl aminopeptidase
LLLDISHYTKKSPQNKCTGSFILKSEGEISLLRESAYLVRDLLLQLHKIIKPGVNELDIASFCENYIIIRGAEPVLKTEKIYPYCILISRNNIAFHGLPEDYILKEGDLITVDVVLLKNGWFGDGAWTYEVGDCSEEVKKLNQFSNNLIYKTVENLKKLWNISAIGNFIESECKNNNYRVIDEGAGHGIGRSIHEDPHILFNRESESIELQTGMVFTIEPVITNSTETLQFSDTGVAFLNDKSYVSQFEHMIAVNDSGIEILTDRN